MSEPKRIPIPLRERIRDWLRGPLPLLVWLAAGAGAVFLLRGRPGPGVLQGTVVEPAYPLAFADAGVLDQWLVAPGEVVAAGQPLALLRQDALAVTEAGVRSRLTAIGAEIDALRARHARRLVESQSAELLESWSRDVARLDADRDARSDARRFALDAAELRIDTLGEEVDLAVARLERGRVQVRLDRGRALEAQDLFNAATVQDLELELAQLDAEVEARLAQTNAVRSARDEALGRLTTFDNEDAASTIPALDGGGEAIAAALADELDAEIAVVQARLGTERVELQKLVVLRASRILEAPLDGVLGDFRVLAGQYAGLDIPVTELRVPSERKLQLWLPAELGDQAPEPGASMVVARTAPRAAQASAQILRVADRISALPAPLQSDPTRPRYGRALFISVPLELGLLPGEVVLGWAE